MQLKGHSGLVIIILSFIIFDNELIEDIGVMRGQCPLSTLTQFSLVVRQTDSVCFNESQNNIELTRKWGATTDWNTKH